MGQISLSIPQTGQPNTTEDPKVASDLTTIQTVINGNLDDTNLKSPNSAVRRLLFQASGLFLTANVANTYILGDGISPVTNLANTTLTLPIWRGDVDSEFTVANKSAFAELRAVVATNPTAPAVNFTVGLYSIGTTSGGAGSISFSLSTPAVGSVLFSTPSASGVATGKSSAFALPGNGQLTAGWVLAVSVSGTPAANSATMVSAQLYGYNA